MAQIDIEKLIEMLKELNTFENEEGQEFVQMYDVLETIKRLTNKINFKKGNLYERIY